MARFILNDETKVNSYGFRVLNSGIDITRFEANPVMLDEHINSTKAVVGRWLNAKILGVNLIADSEFDTENIESAELARKVKKGYIKGASIGISFNEADMVMANDGIFNLIKCELFEASICAIPSNANAIKLYTKSGSIISENTFKLSISSLTKKTKNTNMDLLKSLIELLGLDSEATEQDVFDAVETLIKEKESVSEKRAEELVKMALSDGRIDKVDEEFFMDAAKRDYELTSRTVQRMRPRASLSGMVKNTISTDKYDKVDKSKWTLDDYRKNSPKELQQNPALYKKLIEEANPKLTT